MRAPITFGAVRRAGAGNLRHGRLEQPLQLSARESGRRAKREMRLSDRIRGRRRRSATRSKASSTCRKNAAHQAHRRYAGGLHHAVHVTSISRCADGTDKELGIGYLRFRTFENLAAVSNLAGFLASFRITGTSDPAIQVAGPYAVYRIHGAIRGARIRSAWLTGTAVCRSARARWIWRPRVRGTPRENRIGIGD